MLVEDNIQITLPSEASFRKFDDPASHGLSHCMKAVDFVVELPNETLFIEIKDPQHPRARPANTARFISDFLGEKLDEDLKYKYRDSFLYEWASGQANKPIHYWVIVAINSLSPAAMLTRTEALKRKLPLDGPPSGRWQNRIVAGCMVVNIESWNRHLPDFPAARV